MKRILAILVLGVALGLGLFVMFPSTASAVLCPSGYDQCKKIDAANKDCVCSTDSAKNTPTAPEGQYCCAIKELVTPDGLGCQSACLATITPGTGIPTGVCEGRTIAHTIKGCEACPKGSTCVTEACCLLDLIYTVADWIFVILLVVAGIFIIWGGIEFVTSGGVPEKITSGRNKLIWALVGVVIAFVAKGLVGLISQIIK